jgi:hypothetical protein
MSNDEQELLKTGVKAAVEMTLRPFGDLIKSIFGGSAEQIGLMWTDALAARRIRRLVPLMESVRTVLKDAHIDPRQIPDNIWLPILQEATLQDDETLQEKWANLLANAADPRQTNPVIPSFSSILKDLTFREARFLDVLYKLRLNNPQRFDSRLARHHLLDAYVEAGLSISPYSRLWGLSIGDYEKGGDELRRDLENSAEAIDVLLRNRILREEFSVDPIDITKMPAYVERTQRLPKSLNTTITTQYHLTTLGFQFIKACQKPNAHSGEHS